MAQLLIKALMALPPNNLVNKCADGVNCTEAEQQMNRRTEFKVIEGN